MITEALAARKPKGGNYFFVSASTDPLWERFTEMFASGSVGKTRVFTSLAACLDAGLFTDGGDDIVFVAPGHSENVAAAAGLNTGTTAAGLTILGLGEGDERPIFNFITAAGADFDIGSNGVTLENLRFDLTGVDGLTGPIDINDSGCTIRNCHFITADADGQAVVAIVTDANADDLLIEGNTFFGTEVAGTVSAIRLVGGDNLVIRKNDFIGSYRIVTGAIEATTTAPGLVIITENNIQNRTLLCTRAMNFVAGTRALITKNMLGIQLNTSPISVSQTLTATGVGFIQVAGNYYKSGTTISAAVLL